jgi:hypothetical protein
MGRPTATSVIQCRVTRPRIPPSAGRAARSARIGAYAATPSTAVPSAFSE